MTFTLLRLATPDNVHSLALSGPANNKAICFQSVPVSDDKEHILDVQVLPSDDAGIQAGSSLGPVLGCLGAARFGGEDFLFAVRDATLIGNLDGHPILQIKRVSYHCVANPKYDAARPLGFANDYSATEAVVAAHRSSLAGPQNASCELLTEMLNQGTFYFSPSSDISKTTQQSTRIDWSALDQEFLWNQFLLKPIIKFHGMQDDGSKHFLETSGLFPLTVQGFVGCAEIGSELSLWTLSRISSIRAGTRYSYRGLDDDGHVANFVQTETILAHPRYMCAYVIVRGSVPVFWDQQGIQVAYSKIQLTRSPIATQPSFERHVNNLRSKYGLVHAVDLLSHGRDQSEQLLSGALEYHVRKLACPDESFSLTHFDLNQDLLAAGQEKLEDLFQLLCYELPVFSYFVKDIQSGKAIRKQKGVFRVSCFDCLDRTNLAQSFLSGKVMDLFVRNYLGDTHSQRALADLRGCLNEIWADNGDQLSIIYTGSGALKSSLTRTGQYTVRGFMSDVKKSAKRLYSGQFSDPAKNDVIRLLLGVAQNQETVKLHNLFELSNTAAMPVEQKSEIDELSVKCITWNVNGLVPLPEDIQPLFSMASMEDRPDILAIGFQEIVNLNPSQIISVDPERKLVWERHLMAAINSLYGKDVFSLLVSNQLVGTTLSVYVRNEVVHLVRNVEIAKKMTGLGGMAGNKGSVAVWLDVQDSTFCFVSSHFAAGQVNVVDRNSDWNMAYYELVSNSGRTIHTREYAPARNMPV